MILAAVSWLVAACLGMCLVEYAVHRWLMHGRFAWLGRTHEAHVLLHHGRYFRRFDSEPDRAAHHISIELSPWLNVIGLLPLWLPLCLVSPQGGLTFAAVAWLHGLCWTAMHREMHGPKGRWFGRLWLYRYIRENHRTHHRHPHSNYNAVFPPLADLLFGTHKRGSCP